MIIDHTLYYFDLTLKVIVLHKSGNFICAYTILTDAPIESQETVENKNLIKN